MLKNSMKRLWWLALLPFVVVLGFVIWASLAASPQPEALAVLESDALVTVETEPWLTFRPTQPTFTGFILYPGGRVDPRAYAPAAHALAAEGYLVVIVPMPLNLAVLGAERANKVIAAFPEVTVWEIGGHSLGGAMAAHYAHAHPQAVEGLVLWAAYPAAGDDLSTSELAVLSISGTQDGLSTPDKIEASRALLPPTTEWVPIEGGNHAQFGWYGPQAGDNPATISQTAQQRQIIAATRDFLDALEAER